jgi:ubiquinone/menaquinone biosynthesis C-methylase UbiE
MATEEAEYVLGANEAERLRLLQQGEAYRTQAELLVDRCDIAPGADALDVGCGPLGILDLLSERVGPHGSVTGIDREQRMLEFAAKSLAERGVEGVHLLAADAAATGLPDASFDLVHERLVLLNVVQTEKIVAELVRLTRPGGWVALQEYDTQSWFCQPGHAAWDTLFSALSQVWVGDPYIGRRLPGLLRGAGLNDVGVDAHAAVYGPDDPSHWMLPYAAEIYHDRILDLGTVSEDDLVEARDELRKHLGASGTFTSHVTLFQAWGRKPSE